MHAADTKDVDMAVEAARRAFNGEWRTLDTSVRGELLYKRAGLIEQHADVLATIDAWDNGTRVFYSARSLSSSNLHTDDLFLSQARPTMLRGTKMLWGLSVYCGITLAGLIKSMERLSTRMQINWHM